MKRILEKSNSYKLILTLKIVMFTLPLIFFSSGCTMVAHDLMIKDNTNLAKTLNQAPSPSPSYSRVVFYAPRSPLAGLSLGVVGGFSVLPVVIEGQNKIFHGNVLDQTGFFLDIPSGNYNITCKPATIIDDTKAFNTYFAPSQTYIIKAEAEVGNITSKKPVLVTNIDQTLAEMEKQKVRYCRPVGFTEALKHLPLDPALIPNMPASSVWKSSAFPQTKPAYTSRVYVLNRTFIAGAALRPSVGLDCLPDIEIDKTKYVCFEVTPGKHVFSLKVGCFTREGTVPIMGLNIDVKSGQDYFIDFAPTRGFSLMPQKEADKIANKTDKLAKNGYFCRTW